MNCRSSNVRLRPFVAVDEEAMRAIFCDPEVMQFSDHGVPSPQFVREWLQERIAEYGTSTLGTWAVDRIDGPSAIGYLGINHSTSCRNTDEAELGFRLARAYWRRGYGLEIARLGLRHAFERVGLLQVIARVDPGNIASIAIVERLGFRFDQLIMLPGYTHPDRLYVCSRQHFDRS